MGSCTSREHVVDTPLRKHVVDTPLRKHFSKCTFKSMNTTKPTRAARRAGWSTGHIPPKVSIWCTESRTTRGGQKQWRVKRR